MHLPSRAGPPVAVCYIKESFVSSNETEKGKAGEVQPACHVCPPARGDRAALLFFFPAAGPVQRRCQRDHSARVVLHRCPAVPQRVIFALAGHVTPLNRWRRLPNGCRPH